MLDKDDYKMIAADNGYSVIFDCDEGFPKLSSLIKSAERPKMLAYRGDISLLSGIENNVAIVGVLTPTAEIIEREKRIVAALAKRNKTIVSGLALGCDTIAHEVALEFDAKTIAILPSTLDNIYPKQNKKLSESIVQNGGLVITEYLTKSTNRFDIIKRFIERDRLQAMFASAIILIASYRKGEGDSGSRHAMQKAKIYGKKRFVMFNESTDTGNPIFGLNQDLCAKGVPALSADKLDEI